MATTWFSTNTELGLINALTQSLTVYLPNDAPQGKNLFVKDAAGNSVRSTITLTTQGVDTYLNCTFSFRCDGFINHLGYYFELSNTTRSLTNLTGKIFTNVYPYMENENNFLPGNHSISVQDQFNTTTWTNGDTFLPMMFVKCKTGSGILSNMEFSMVYEPLIEYYP